MNSVKNKLSRAKGRLKFTIEPPAAASTYRITIKTIRVIQFRIRYKMRSEWLIDQVNIDGGDQ